MFLKDCFSNNGPALARVNPLGDMICADQFANAKTNRAAAEISDGACGKTKLNTKDPTANNGRGIRWQNAKTRQHRVACRKNHGGLEVFATKPFMRGVDVGQQNQSAR